MMKKCYLLLFIAFLVANSLYAQLSKPEKTLLKAEKKEARILKRLQRSLADSLVYKESYYNYALLQDLDNRNFENLGWWQYQYNQLNKRATDSLFTRPQDSLKTLYAKKQLVMLIGVLTNIYEVEANRPPGIRDLPAVVFLLMLRTIINPKDYIAYLSVVAYSSKMEDYGTALFYLEEAFKNGYNDLDTLGNLPETGLLRIMPEYQALLEVYLNKGRYGIREEGEIE